MTRPDGSTMRRSGRAERSDGTREAILTAAEKLFAEHGVFAVSNRQVSEAAGQGNNAAVGYHFGTKTDLIRAIVRRHNEQVERICQDMLDRAAKPASLRDWVDCLVRPLAQHLTELGSPTTYARFSAQLMPDPSHRDLVSEESLGSSSVLRIIEGLNRELPDMPEGVRVERNAMARQLIVHMFAERERALADSAPTPHPSWAAMATSLVDAITGLMLAPITEAGVEES
ncbi:MAG: TetR/AcrR family transcriptional regulator [Planctomycetaceae bacterium]|nr:TetR/AcrR family transcriptional regulator [Planctomycetaceae bacterium]